MASERVTVTLPRETVRDIDREGKNRSRFVLQAVQRELARRRRLYLRESLANPHVDSLAVAEEGLDEWHRSLPPEDADGLVDVSAGTGVRWTDDGWTEVEE